MRTEVLVKDLINKMFEIAQHDVSYEDILHVENWFNKYTMTQEQSEEWCVWGTEYIRKNFKLSKVMARKKMDWANLMWGLTVAPDKV